MKKTCRILLGVLLLGGLVTWPVLLWVERSYQREDRTPTEIVDGLYVGGNVPNPPPRTSAVLNLCSSRDKYAEDIEIHVWESIRDGAPVPDLKWLQKQIEWIRENREAGRVVFVHCRNGVSRSGMVAAAYLMSENRWSRDRALEFIREKRPLIRPNPAFMELLLEWEEVVLKDG